LIEAYSPMTSRAQRSTDCLDCPSDFFSRYTDADNAAAYLASLNRPDFDRRDLRRAFGQVSTSVNVVTALGADGEPVGMTINSFPRRRWIRRWCLGVSAGMHHAPARSSQLPISP
jgi:hypothetical protein